MHAPPTGFKGESGEVSCGLQEWGLVWVERSFVYSHNTKEFSVFFNLPSPAITNGIKKRGKWKLRFRFQKVGVKSHEQK